MAKQTFKMPYIPEASVNHSHGRGRQGQTYLKPEAAQWANVLRQMVQTWADEHGIRLEKGHEVLVTLHADFPPRGGRGAGRKPDSHNLFKLAVDAIASALGIDDWSFKTRDGQVTFGNDEGGWLYYEVEI